MCQYHYPCFFKVGIVLLTIGSQLAHKLDYKLHGTSCLWFRQLFSDDDSSVNLQELMTKTRAWMLYDTSLYAKSKTLYCCEVLLRVSARAKMIVKGGMCTTGCDKRELCGGVCTPCII